MKHSLHFRNLIVLHVLGLLVAGVLFFTSRAGGDIIKIVFAVLLFSLLLQCLMYKYKPGWWGDKIKKHPEQQETNSHD